ncbi:hypothetical protein ACFQV2_03385 [Actinokineospora soli]|uniref:DUF4145 domain-containing protein n=1 Tax=Actinokineospora soli TaxID=1048753 RepID=A0ABW2TI62_9PSEU
MSVLEFIQKLVDALAWPTAVVLLAVTLRSKLGPLLGDRLKALKAGPGGLELEWNETAQQAEQQIVNEVTSTESATDQTMPLRLLEVAKNSPRGAVMDASGEIERALRALLARDGLNDKELRMGMGELSSTAFKREVISAPTHNAILGISTLRNLAAHGRGTIDYSQAVEFLALADAVMYSLSTPKQSPGSPEDRQN